jgi:hypothetical protein
VAADPRRSAFFTITKAFHNALQGGHYDLHESEQDIYLKVNKQSAELLDNNYDVIFVHDPQPAALRHFTGARRAKWVWRCHIDSSSPDHDVRDFLVPYIHEYDAFVFTMMQCAASDPYYHSDFHGTIRAEVQDPAEQGRRREFRVRSCRRQHREARLFQAAELQRSEMITLAREAARVRAVAARFFISWPGPYHLFAAHGIGQAPANSGDPARRL